MSQDEVVTARCRLTVSLAAAALLFAGGCGGREEPELSGEAIPTELLAQLAGAPQRLPEEPASGTPVVMLTVGLAGERVRVEGRPIEVDRSLRFVRAKAALHERVPDYWVLQARNEHESYHYWTPIDPSPRIRVNLSEDLESQKTVGGVLTLKEVLVAFRLPYYRGGRVDFFHSDGRVVGRFRFGDHPEAPLQPVGDGV